MSPRNTRSQDSMRIRLTQDRRERMLRSVQAFCARRLDVDLSPLGAEQLIEFFVKELGAPVYNQAIQDARAYLQGRLDELEGEFYEPDEPLSRLRGRRIDRGGNVCTAPPEGMAMQIGVISDTHGLVRPEAISALRGSDLILHAGDIGSGAVLDALRRIAPVHAVRGNTDSGPWAEALPTSEVIEAGSHLFHMLHEIAQLDLDPVAAGFSAVVCGHSHRPSVERRNGVLLLNPGSAGPRRLDLPVSLATIRVHGAQLAVELIALDT